MLLVLAILLIMAWKTAGYLGLDYYPAADVRDAVEARPAVRRSPEKDGAAGGLIRGHLPGPPGQRCRAGPARSYEDRAPAEWN